MLLLLLLIEDLIMIGRFPYGQSILQILVEQKISKPKWNLGKNTLSCTCPRAREDNFQGKEIRMFHLVVSGKAGHWNGENWVSTRDGLIQIYFNKKQVGYKYYSRFRDARRAAKKMMNDFEPFVKCSITEDPDE